MEIQTKDSYLKFHNFHDKELLKKMCNRCN